MGSKIEPYFILTAEKVTDPRELQNIRNDENDTPDKLPTTPPPSGVSGQTGTDIILKFGQKSSRKKKGFVKYKIPIKELRRKDTLNKKMEIIKEKLEKSRERFKGQTRSNEEINLMCGPAHLNKDLSSSVDTFKLDRSKSDMSPVKQTEGSSPYTYFVVSDDIKEDAIGKSVSKSADKRRRVRNAEENRWKRERTDGQKSPVKKVGLARELGIKSSIKLKPDSSGSSKPSISHIIFEGPESQEQPKFHNTNSKIIRSVHSPPRIPPCTPSVSLFTHLGESKTEQPVEDTDDSVPRKPFLSGPLYSGKNRGTHSFSLQHLELPNISADQKRRALGLGTKFEEFTYPKPQSEQRQRNFSFLNALPVVKGTGMLFNFNEMKENIGLEIPPLGPRSMTLGSILLPSEKLDKQSMCQKYIAGDSMATAKRVKKTGTPMSLPKIDIVSNVYDDMIIKMIKEYLQDTETPSRQSQLAKELLVHLQKHNEHMKELNVPNLNKKQKQKVTKEDILKSHSKTQQLINDMNFVAPPNSAEDFEAKVMTPLAKTREIANSGMLEEREETGVDRQLLKSADNPRSIPFVQITFKDRALENDSPGYLLAKEDSTLSNSKEQTKEKKSNERPILSAVTPVSFQMAPPGLSKEDSFITAQASYKTQLLAKT
ncbi:uncharacterized protein LOC132759707 [Ruditapes philippinarum]|uniref:uncharacterized protein LOC132759707 n=1 Tax=Ruditapes philippinarum TaxID=129788 RepID=UPI00295ABD0B|nr:uncharacterized protein LOC132759707 [Ruditapes philippinarum]XP_060607509.1 uncharacterized protein LOC132759707 [Ruditapes philippinarum]XP_060607510.1 uncharacterized protein LOC132759707 [Ruditapes philippinarum]